MLKAERDAEEARARSRAKPSARAREVMRASVAKPGSEESIAAARVRAERGT